MTENYPPKLVDATPDEVMAILRDQHREQCTHDPEADWSINLCRESTIDDWREACDLVGWIPLAQALNAEWEMHTPLDEWRAVLEPARQRTLGGVLDLIAAQAKVPRVRPLRIMGRECIPAGAFLTVRSLLASAGANVSDVAPSTPLAPWTRRYARVFLGPVSRLAPDAMPLVKIRTPLYHGCVLAFFASIVLMGISHCAGLELVVVCAVLAAGISYLGIWVAARWVLPASVEFEGLTTFRDLSLVIATKARSGAGATGG